MGEAFCALMHGAGDRCELYKDVAAASLQLRQVGLAKLYLDGCRSVRPHDGSVYALLADAFRAEENALRAFRCLFMAGAVAQPSLSVSEDLHSLALQHCNVSLKTASDKAVFLIATTVLIHASAKYRTKWADALNTAGRLSGFDGNAEGILSTLLLMLIYLQRTFTVHCDELHQVFVKLAKKAAKNKANDLHFVELLYEQEFSARLKVSSHWHGDSNGDLSILLARKTAACTWTIVDLDVLIEGWEEVKNRLFESRIRMLVPLAIIRCLDKLKRRGGRASEISAYLDDVIAHGSQVIRIQSVAEHCPGDMRQLIFELGLKEHHFDMIPALKFYSADQANEYVLVSENKSLLRIASRLRLKCETGL